MSRQISGFFSYVHEHGVISSAKLTLNYLGFKNYSTITYPVGAVKLTVRSHILWLELEKKRWEHESLKYLAEKIREGQTVFDIGAWMGPYTVFCSKLVRNSGHVYAFEPDPVALNILNSNIAKNKMVNVTVEQKCVSNKVGSTTLSAENFGASLSTVKKGTTRTAKELVVETTTIDEYCKQKNVYPNIIKIDVEGAEASVIEGARETIQKHKPCLFLEYHSVFMSPSEAKERWQKITDGAKEILFLEGESKIYKCRDPIKEMPESPTFRVFIQY